MNGGKVKSRLVMLTGSAAGLAVAALLLLWMVQGAPRKGGSRDDQPLEGLQVFDTVPPFSLVERSGKPVTRDDLIGKVWIANFIYTHCPDTCPLQTAEMARLQSALTTETDLRLVSITVDPQRDTPAVLTQYANRYGADPNRWLFLTGEKAAIYHLAQDGFRLSVVDPEQKADGPLFAPTPAFAHHGETEKQFLHSARFVLVDRQARIRGYYQSNDEESLQHLRRDARTLLQRER